ncbi:MAG: SDR family NAD(P)-dependent oxidoreductase [Pseudomonadota bacterium]
MSDNVKTAVITGGTGGIGLETALGLAAKGWRIIVTGRDAERASDATQELLQAGAIEAVSLTADLAKQSEVVRLASQLTALAPKLDVLVNNAGALPGERKLTQDGVELALAVNHVAPWLLTNALLPSLKAAGHARVVIVSSSGHRFVKFKAGEMEPSGPYIALTHYGHAKLINLMTMFAWARELSSQGVSLLASDPGSASTGMTQAMNSSYLPWYMRFIWPLMNLLFGGGDPDESRRKAAASSILAASDPTLEGETARYIGPNGKVAAPSKIASNPDNQAEALRMTREAFDPALMLSSV